MEHNKKFIAFLWAFGVKGIEEYNTFSEKEKLICRTEFFKSLKHK